MDTQKSKIAFGIAGFVCLAASSAMFAILTSFYQWTETEAAFWAWVTAGLANLFAYIGIFKGEKRELPYFVVVLTAGFILIRFVLPWILCEGSSNCLRGDI